MATAHLLEEYYRDITRKLKGTSSYKQRILENITTDADEFLKDHPNATEQDIRQYFGNPEDFIREYGTTMMQQEQTQGKRFRHRILAVIVAVLLAGLLIWSASVISVTVEANKNSRDSYIVEIIKE